MLRAIVTLLPRLCVLLLMPLLLVGVGHAQTVRPPRQPFLQPRVTAQHAPTAPQPIITTSGAVGHPLVLHRPPGVRAASLTLLNSATDWTVDFADSFEQEANGTIPPLGTIPTANWYSMDYSDDGAERTWGIDTTKAYSGTRSLWVAAAGADGIDPAHFAVPDNLNTWLTISRTFDLRGMQSADVEFYMYMDTEPITDTIFVGASVDDQTYYGQFWSGSSGGWQYYNLDLAEFLGAPQVYISWAYLSDGGNADGKGYEGVWLDEVKAWTYVDQGAPAASDQLLNGDFETGDLTSWTTPLSSTVIVTGAVNPLTGTQVARMGGVDNINEILYQPLTFPDLDNSSATLGFWVNPVSTETTAGTDLFCAGFYGATASGLLDPQNLVVDLGCMDSVDAYTDTFDAQGWRQVNVLLSAEEWQKVRGQTLYAAFELFTDAQNSTTVYLDDVTVIVVEAVSPGDALEPNDYLDVAISTTLPISYTGLTIDPDHDYDNFRVAVPVSGTLVVDIDAASIGSPLDGYLFVLNEQGAVLCEVDDDDMSLDPYVACPLPAPGVYFVGLTSYDQNGDRSQVYNLSVRFVPPDAPPPPAPGPDKEVITPPTPVNTWTAILYLDGDTNLCGVYPGLVTRIEEQLRPKIGPDGFLKIVALLDRVPIYCQGDGTATRYYIQPDGQYTDDVNRWAMGEINMGDPATLQNFIEWSMHNYPADHYYLALDNHGAGITGIAWDDTNRDASNKKDRLTNTELYSVLKTVTRNGQRKIDLLAYEACLMGSFESAYDARSFADQLFFFPSVSYTTNNSYPAYFSAPGFTSTTSSRVFGDIVFDTYYANVAHNAYAMTLVETAAITQVHTALNTWADALRAQLPAQRTQITLARQQAQKFDSNGDKKLTEDDYYLDLWDLADKLAAQGLAVTEAMALKTAIDDAVVRTVARSLDELDYGNSHGLTIFWPQVPGGWYDPYRNGQIYTATRTGRWDEFLEAYFAGISARDGLPVDPGPANREPATVVFSFAYLPLVAK